MTGQGTPAAELGTSVAGVGTSVAGLCTSMAWFDVVVCLGTLAAELGVSMV